MKVKRLFLTLLGGTMVFLLVMGLIFSGSNNVNANEFDIKNETLIDDLRASDSEITIDGITKNYYVADKLIEIIDDKDEIIIKLKLLTPYENKIGLNKPVAEWLLIDWKDRTETFDSVISYDKNTDYKTIEKVYTWKYKKIIPTEVCYDVPVNNTDSKDSLIEKENITIKECYTYNKTEWITFNSLNDLPEKNIVIGLFTDTKYGDYVEFVPTIGDFQLSEFASYLVTDLISYYKLDDTSGTTSEDSTGFSNMSEIGSSSTPNSMGILNKAWHFNQDSGKLVGDTNVGITGNDARTISAWVKMDAGATETILWGFGVASPSNTHWTMLLRPGRLYFSAWANDMNMESTTSSTTTETWYHVVVTHNGTTTRVYLDGVSVGNKTTTYNTEVSAFEIGGNPQDQSTAGDVIVDEVGIWSRALNSTEISELYNSGDGLSYDDFSKLPATCEFSGYIFDETNTVLEGANVTVWDQYNVTKYYEDTSDSNGLWAINLTNSTNIYMVGAYYNNTLIGQLKPYISGTC